MVLPNTTHDKNNNNNNYIKSRKQRVPLNWRTLAIGVGLLLMGVIVLCNRISDTSPSSAHQRPPDAAATTTTTASRTPSASRTVDQKLQWHGLSLEQSELWQSLPIFPLLNTTHLEQHKALDDVFAYTLDRQNSRNGKGQQRSGAGGGGGGGGGWIHVNQLQFEDVNRLREHGKIVMARNTSCQGKLKVSQPNNNGNHNEEKKHEVADGLEHCFWDNDLVSRAALRNFDFEPILWKWVLSQFQTLEQELSQEPNKYDSASTTTTSSKSPCHLAFFDIGVNVGDWASPLRLAFPTTTPYFGIEGSPGTAAIATANLRTSMEHCQRSTNVAATTTTKTSVLQMAPTALLPFSLLSKRMIPKVQTTGFVCFEDVFWNLGGQGIKADTVAEGAGDNTAAQQEECRPSLMAGGTLLPHALQALIPLLQESSCPGRLDWPRIYIAKLDIEGFEFKTLTSAIDWLMERPPCYLMVEFHQVPQNGAIMELLLDVGYDSLWRSHNTFAPNAQLAHEEFPSSTNTTPPFWSRSRNSSAISLHSAVAIDMSTIGTGYKDYIFGFENRDACLRRLME